MPANSLLHTFVLAFLSLLWNSLPTHGIELVKQWELDTKRSLSSAQMTFAGSDGSFVLTIQPTGEASRFLWVSQKGQLLVEITNIVSGIFLHVTRSNIIFVGSTKNTAANSLSAVVWNVSGDSIGMTTLPIDAEKYLMGVSFDLNWGHFSHHREQVPPPILVQKGTRIVCYTIEGEGLYPPPFIEIRKASGGAIEATASNPTPRPAALESSEDLQHWVTVGKVPPGASEIPMKQSEATRPTLFLRAKPQ